MWSCTKKKKTHAVMDNDLFKRIRCHILLIQHWQCCVCVCIFINSYISVFYWFLTLLWNLSVCQIFLTTLILIMMPRGDIWQWREEAIQQRYAAQLWVITILTILTYQFEILPKHIRRMVKLHFLLPFNILNLWYCCYCWAGAFFEVLVILSLSLF